MSEKIYLIENFITNTDEILELVKKHEDKFSSRAKGDEFEVNLKYGPSKFHSMFHFNMPDELKEAIFRTMPEEVLMMPPDEYCINRYMPGSFMARHSDICGSFYKFYLIFLQSDKPHFKYYNEEHPEGVLVEEKPGSRFEMPIELEHEVVEIGPDERPKISLVMSWKI